MNGYTFERWELKYRITDAQRAALEAAFGTQMIPDEYGESTICNIYYDTADYRLIRASLEKPAYKEKLRLRSYGVTEPGGEVFLAEFAPAGANKVQSIFASRLANVRA